MFRRDSEDDLDLDDYETEDEDDLDLDDYETEDENDIDPDDYETEDEYYDAIEDARTAWQDLCEDGREYGIDPEQYETEDEYDDALRKARAKRRDTHGKENKHNSRFEDYDEYSDDLQEAGSKWQEICEAGRRYDIDPEDYETAEEYLDALQEAIEEESGYAIDPEDYDTEEEYLDALQEALDEESEDEDSSSVTLELSLEWPDSDELEEINEEDFPNKRRYEAACALAEELSYNPKGKGRNKTMECCQFIMDKADKIIAANYLSYDDGFLYAQAIKDNFKLPVSLPDEDECREYEFTEVLCKIYKRDPALAFEVWEWSLKTFLPYAQYAQASFSEMTTYVIDELNDFPDSWQSELVRYMEKHPDFFETVLDEKAELSDELSSLVAAALQDGLTDMAFTLFQRGLAQAGGKWQKINSLTQGTVSLCQNYDELESAEFVKLKLLPLVKEIDIGMVQDEIEEWEKELDEYISEVEDDCEQYAYTRKNAWRKTAPDSELYGLDPRDYFSEQEYLEALEREKHVWREWYEDEDTRGLNVNDFETEEEYLKAYGDRVNEEREKERKQRQEERLRIEEQKKAALQQQYIEAEKKLADKRIYTYCGVIFPHKMQVYHYRTEDETITIGDTVLVPTRGNETAGKVVSVGRYLRIAAPFPVEKAKFVTCKAEEDKKP